MADFTATEVEDGTGLTTSVVYETVAATATWLVARGYASFNAATEAVKKNAALKATEELQDALRSLGFQGAPLVYGQRLLWPAEGAYRDTGEIITSGTVPNEMLEACRLAAEAIVAGTWLSGLATAGVQSRSAPGGASVAYRSGSGSVSVDHPNIARRLRAISGRAYG